MKFFISAATKGLGSYRPAIAEKLRRAGYDAFHQAEAPADSGTVRNMLHTQMSDCHAVICLIGPAFGFLCPSTDPLEPPRSYTQIEYDLATRVFGKPTFVFFAKETARLDPFEQSAEDASRQRDFALRLRTQMERKSERLYYEFETVVDVRDLLDECARNAARGPLESGLVDYPLPLALAYDKVRGLDFNRPEPLDDAAAWVLELVALLALQDATARGASIDLPAEVGASEASHQKWRALLSKVVPNTGFIRELVEWHRDNAVVFDEIAATVKRLGGWLSPAELDSVPAQARHLVESLILSLGWLSNYVIAAFSPGGQSTVRILRGNAASHVTLPLDAAARISVEEQLFLLSLERQNALSLFPALWCLPREHAEQPVSATETIKADDNLCLELKALGPNRSGGPANTTWLRSHVGRHTRGLVELSPARFPQACRSYREQFWNSRVTVRCRMEAARRVDTPRR